MKLLGVQWGGTCQHITSKVKDKLLDLAFPTTEERHKAWWASLNFRGNIFLIWICYFGLFTRWPKKLLVLSVAQNKRSLCQQVQSAGQAALPLGQYDPGGPTLLEVSVADRAAVWSLWQAPISELQFRPLGFGSKTLPTSAGKLLPFWEIDLGLLLGLCRDWMLNHHGPPSYHVIWAASHVLGFLWTTKLWSWACTAAFHNQMEVVYTWSSLSRSWSTNQL